MNLFDIAKRKVKIETLEQEMLAPDFWQDQEKAQTVTQEKGRHERVVARYQTLADDIDDMLILVELAKEDEASDYTDEKKHGNLGNF